MNRLVVSALACVTTACICGGLAAKERVVVVPAHPDDLIPCFGTCLLSKDIFEWHVIEFTHGERGMGEQGFRDGSTKKIRMAEEGAVCKELGTTLHWLDEIDGEAYASRETCERLAALLKELNPRAVFAHWPVDIHGDHAMAGVAVQKAIFLAGISPEIYFMEQEYQAKRFVPDQFVDITDVMERKCELIRMYKCQYRNGDIERRKRTIAKVNGLHSMLPGNGCAEGFMSFVQPLQGQGRTIFQELPPPKSGWTIRFQGARNEAVDEAVSFSRYRFDTGKNAPKLFYDAYRPIESGSHAEVAIVLIHGWGGHVRTLLPIFTKALAARAGSDERTPYVIAPQFPRHETIAANKEPEDGRAVWCDSWADEDKHPDQMGSALDDWRGGGDANGTSFSSYDYIDAIFARFADRAKYPNLRKVVLAGFSAGGQFAGRYAATGKGVVRDGVKVVYIAMSPSTEFRFEPEQPWLYGLKGRPRYSAALAEADIMKNLCSRRVWRGCGSLDILGRPKTSLDMTPPAAAQGANRYERFRNFECYLDKYPEWKKQVSFHVFEGIAHKEDLCYPDPALLDFVFE